MSLVLHNLKISEFGTYLEYFTSFEESCVFLIAESEEEVERDPAVLLLEHEAHVSVPGGPRRPRRPRGAHGASLSAGILDQTLPPSAEGRRLHPALRLHLPAAAEASPRCVRLHAPRTL